MPLAYLGSTVLSSMVLSALPTFLYVCHSVNSNIWVCCWAAASDAAINGVNSSGVGPGLCGATKGTPVTCWYCPGVMTRP
eukprot:13695181-Ditylum_brightwellii.AAC.1